MPWNFFAKKQNAVGARDLNHILKSCFSYLDFVLLVIIVLHFLCLLSFDVVGENARLCHIFL